MAVAVGARVPLRTGLRRVTARLRSRVGDRLGRPRREHILRRAPRGAICAEVGVYRGQFTRHILTIAQPRRLHLIDGWWTLYGECFPDWGEYTDYGRITTRGAYKEVQEVLAAAGAAARSEIHVGDDVAVLASFPDGYFDWVYLDSSHEYEHTRRELEVLEDKLKPSGMVFGDDWHNDDSHVHAGVAAAARELCETGRWSLVVPGDRFGQWMIQRA